jgi:hypothetical protein
MTERQSISRLAELLAQTINFLALIIKIDVFRPFIWVDDGDRTHVRPSISSLLHRKKRMRLIWVLPVLLFAFQASAQDRATKFEPYVTHDRAVTTMEKQNMTGGGTQTFSSTKTGETPVKPSSPAVSTQSSKGVRAD